MFALSDARDYSFSKVPYLEREEEITDQSNFVKNLIIFAIECKMYLKIQQKLHCLWLHFKTNHALRREENKVEFLEGRFLDEKLPFLHKKKAEHSFELSLSIFCLLTAYL